LPWILQKLERTPVKNKKGQNEVPFAAADLPDEEEEGDDEYDPSRDPEAPSSAVEDNDEEDAGSLASATTPTTSLTPASAANQDILATPRVDDLMATAGEEDVFKHPFGVKSNHQVTHLDEAKNHASR